jgi:hypothetical protein
MPGSHVHWHVHGPFGDVDIELFPTSIDAATRDGSLRELGRLVYELEAHRPETRRALMEVHARLRGLRGSGVREDEHAVGTELLFAARAGALLVRRKVRSIVPLPVEETQEPVLGPEAEPTAWIELELVDEDGDAVPGVDYRIECDDGRVRTGTTSGSGKAREEGLHAGNCKVSFPALNGPDWKKAG